MLNKNQSHKRNSWKYALVIPALIGFVFLFQIKVIAQEKEIQTNSNAEMIVYYSFEKNSTDKEISEDVKSLKKDFDIECTISKIKRNSDNELIAINVNLSANDGEKYTINLKGTKPINAIKFGCFINNKGKGELIFYGKEKTDIEIKNEKTAYNLDFSTEKQENFWTINEIKKDGKNILIIIDGEKQDNIQPIKIDNSREIDKIITITKNKDGDEITKYGEEGKNGVTLITTKIISEEPIETIKTSFKRMILIDGQVSDEEALIDLDPNTIEKMEVLEDKTKPQKYITKGTNGIIIITTKKYNSNSSTDGDKKQIKIANGDLKKVKEELERQQPEIEKVKLETESSKTAIEEAKAEMIQAKVAMQQAKADLDAAKAELEKAKAELKKQKK